MQTRLVPRRTQFSSCDACRKSRVACDATRNRSPGAGQGGLDTCTRCANRNQHCTFEWLKRTEARPSTRTLSFDRGDSLPLSPASPASSQAVELNSGPERSPTPSSSIDGAEHASNSAWNANPPTSMPGPALSADTAGWLRVMYEDIFEEVFGSWLGNYGCPFTFGEQNPQENGSNGQSPFSLSVSISSLCSQFDRWMKEVEGEGDQATKSLAESEAEAQKERQIDRSLVQAIQTYSARWLLLTAHSASVKATQNQLVAHLWRELRKDLLKVINRPCYRSMLTLYIFALTPIPAGITEEEEENGIPAQFCVQAALQQVQHLRARQRSIEFNGSKVSPLPVPVAISTSPDQITTDFMGVESIIYWAALTFDTSASLTLNIKSVLSSGLLGWESESSWRLVRTCTNILHDQTEEWRLHGMEVTEINANRIVAGASAWKLLVWKVGAVLKEALREGKEEESVHCAFTAMLKAIEQFNGTYRPLLVACERRIQFLCQHTKLRWYELMLHYHLCVLITIDAIETARRVDLLEQMTVIRSDAEGSVLNCLVFGLNNQFSLTTRNGHPEGSRLSVPLIAIDPYTHHVVAGVKLLGKAIQREYEVGKLGDRTFETLQLTLLKTLEVLPQTSKSVLNAAQQAQASLLRYRNSRRS